MHNVLSVLWRSSVTVHKYIPFQYMIHPVQCALLTHEFYGRSKQLVNASMYHTTKNNRLDGLCQRDMDRCDCPLGDCRGKAEGLSYFITTVISVYSTLSYSMIHIQYSYASDLELKRSL